jgi:hypothetical protein
VEAAAQFLSLGPKHDPVVFSDLGMVVCFGDAKPSNFVLQGRTF